MIWKLWNADTLAANPEKVSKMASLFGGTAWTAATAQGPAGVSSFVFYSKSEFFFGIANVIFCAVDHYLNVVDALSLFLYQKRYLNEKVPEVLHLVLQIHKFFVSLFNLWELGFSDTGFCE